MEWMQDLPVLTLAVFAALAALSVAMVAIAIFKVTQFARMGVGRNVVAETILDDWLNGRPDEAQRLAAQGKTVVARVLGAALSGLRARPATPEYGEELGRQAALFELARMGRWMRLLETVVQAAPMLGLLGTVVGMIDAFGALAQSAQVSDPRLLASGIWTALTTTAIGLALALVAYFIANLLESRIDGERQSIEMAISSAIHGRVATAPAGAAPGARR